MQIFSFIEKLCALDHKEQDDVICFKCHAESSEEVHAYTVWTRSCASGDVHSVPVDSRHLFESIRACFIYTSVSVCVCDMCALMYTAPEELFVYIFETNNYTSASAQKLTSLIMIGV